MDAEGNHVTREAFDERVADRRRRYNRSFLHRHPRTQAVRSCSVRLWPHNSVPQPVASKQGMRYFAQLDSITPDLHLVVHSAQILQLTILTPQADISGPVQSFAGPERVRYETLSSQLLPVQVSSRQPGPANIQLP